MILDELVPAARKLWLLAREQMETWATSPRTSSASSAASPSAKMTANPSSPVRQGSGTASATTSTARRFDLHAVLPLLPPTHVVADLGCGAGELAANLAPHVKTVIGVDNSAEMLKAAKHRANGLTNLDLRKGDLTDLPLEDAEADAALMILALTYVPDPQAAARRDGPRPQARRPRRHHRPAPPRPRRLPPPARPTLARLRSRRLAKDARQQRD